MTPNLETYKNIIETALDEYLPVQYPEKIWESMRYSVLSGGKRIRPIVLLEICRALCGEYEHAIPAACALEMIHVYTLIHDDLPCMDNDDLRRGKPTNHKAYGEAIALLAGDALITHSLQIIMLQQSGEWRVESGKLFFSPNSPLSTLHSPLSLNTTLRLIEEFTTSAGANGVIAGQVVDIESEGREVSAETLDYIHRYKTAELFKLAFRAGAILADADEILLQNVTEIALLVGRAFQVADDILDVIATKEQLGKTPGKDAEAAKATYVTHHGLEKSKKQLCCLVREACDKMIQYNIKSELLTELIKNIEKQIY